MISLDYVKENRQIPFVKRGMKVEHTYNGKTQIGKVVSGNMSGNIQVKFEGDDYSKNCHPNWAMKYFDEDDNVLAEWGE
jgi:hypothetical protein